MVVASEAILSALKAEEALRMAGIGLIVVTSAAGTKIEGTVIGDLRTSIPDEEIWTKLRKSSAQIVRATDPLYNIGAVLEHNGVPSLRTLVRLCMRLISSGTATCLGATMMATDSGLLNDGEEVVAAAGSWVGLDTALVVRAANSVDFLKKCALQVREIICKPRSGVYTWPINQKDWIGDLGQYERLAERKPR